MPEIEGKEGKCQLALVDPALFPRPIVDWEKNVSYPVDGATINSGLEGLKVYTLTHKMACEVLANAPGRYRLIGKTVLDANVRDNNGGSKWIKWYPWKREKNTVQTGVDEETKKPIYGVEYTWTEDPRAIAERKAEEEKK